MFPASLKYLYSWISGSHSTDVESTDIMSESSGEDSYDCQEGVILQPLTWSMEEAKVVHRRESEMNGDILVEEIVRAEGDRSGIVTRRMRFLSNLELEQTEVRLLQVLKREHSTKKPSVSSAMGGKAATARSTRPAPKHVLKADSTYLPYECMQGMLVSLPLLPDWERKDVPEDKSQLLFCYREKLEVLIVGLAGGMLPRFLRFNFPNTSVDCVEIDPVVVDVAREYFGLETDDMLHVHVAGLLPLASCLFDLSIADDVRLDGVDFINKAPENSYDIVIIDANAVEEDKTLEAPPPGFITEECLHKLATIIRPGGILTMNVLCSSPPFFDSILDRIRDAFFGRVCYLRDLAEDADENNVIFALNEDCPVWPPSREELARRLGVLQLQAPALGPLHLQDRVMQHFWAASAGSDGGS